MSLYGKRWKIDGIIAGPIYAGALTAQGEYTILFERAFASIEDIEAINWDEPKIECLREGESGLPFGCGFEMKKIEYSHGNKAYSVTVKVKDQYLGDITQYKTQIEALSSTVESQKNTLITQETEIALLENQLAEADELIIAMYESQMDSGEEDTEANAE